MVDTTHAIASVRRFVWSGLYDPDEVVIIRSESWPGPGKLDTGWLRVEVGKEAVRKKAEEANWPATTDCAGRDRAFAAMEAGGSATTVTTSKPRTWAAGRAGSMSSPN